MDAEFAEPPSRWGHFSAPVKGKFCVWGGCGDKVTVKEVCCFEPLSESWTTITCSGFVPPVGKLYDGACSSSGHHLYIYGGHDGCRYHNSLYQLDANSWMWTLLSSSGPMKITGCGMLIYSGKVVLFGGYGLQPTGSTQPGAKFVEGSSHSGWTYGWTNELHIFDLEEGELILCRGVVKICA